MCCDRPCCPLTCRLRSPCPLPPQLQNGYATHASSAIGNGHAAQASPERELTSPSRLLTHDSTGSGSRSKPGAKRRRTSGAAGSSQHA